MLMYNGKTHYFLWEHRGSVVEQKRLLDGNKLIKIFYLPGVTSGVYIPLALRRSTMQTNEIISSSLVTLWINIFSGPLSDSLGLRCEACCGVYKNQPPLGKIKYKREARTLTIKHNLDFRCIDTRGRNGTSEKKELLMYTMQVAMETQGLYTLLTGRRVLRTALSASALWSYEIIFKWF